jgi:hypothetical protein
MMQEYYALDAWAWPNSLSGTRILFCVATWVQPILLYLSVKPRHIGQIIFLHCAAEPSLLGCRILF